MPIPFLFGAAAAGAAIVGAVQAISGIDKFNQAKKTGESAQQKYESAIQELELEREKLKTIAQDYVRLQMDVNRVTIQRFLAFIQKITCSSQNKEVNLLHDLKISSSKIKTYQNYVLQAEDVLKGGMTAVRAGTTATTGLMALVGIAGSASTGTAISSLSGAAATNATLAWFGGGSLASGGGGMALGSFVLGGVALGSALMVGGFVVAGKGEEALVKAKEYESQVNQAITQINLAKKFLKQVEVRILNLSQVVRGIDKRIIKILNQLESQPFDSNKNLKSLKWATTLIKTIEKIQKTPILDKRGNLNPATEKLLYKDLVKRVEQEQIFFDLLAKSSALLLIAALLSLGGLGLLKFTKSGSVEKFIFYEYPKVIKTDKMKN